MQRFGTQRNPNQSQGYNNYGPRDGKGYNRDEKKGGGDNRGYRGERKEGYEKKPYNQERRFQDKENGYGSKFGRENESFSSRGGRSNFNGRGGRDNFEGRQQASRGGAFGGGDSRGGGFNSRPSKSLVSMSNAPNEARERECEVLTNQFRLSIKNAPPVFQYPITLVPADQLGFSGQNQSFAATTNDIEKVMMRNTRNIQMLIGPFFHSGMNIWTTQKLEDSVELPVTMLTKPYLLRISAEGELPIQPIGDQLATRKRHDYQAYSQILNIIMNQAMGAVDGMVSFGRRPRFFDHTRPIDVKELDMQIWQGFKCSAYMYEKDCVFILDSCNRFMSTKTCLDIINQIYDKHYERAMEDGREWTDRDKKRFQAEVEQELVGKSIVACYGKRQTFRVDKIDFETGPARTFFEMNDGSQMSVARYFLREYKLKIKTKTQPVIYVKAGKDRWLKIPSEFCLVDGVPDSVRNNSQHMRKLLGEVRYNPEQKMKHINGMVNELFKSGASMLAEWGISIEAEPLKLTSRRLAQPELIHHEGQDKLFCNERLLKAMPVFSCEPLSKRQIIFMHDRATDQRDLQSIQRTLEDCQKQIGMKCGRIQSIAINYPRRADQRPDELDRAIKQGLEDLMSRQKIKNPQEELAVIFMVNYEQDYHAAKKIFAKECLITQMMTKRTARRLNLSVASNVMKQLNQKIGGEHIRVELPKVVTNAGTMVIGIDVCHAGKNSVVGFAASTNVACTSYFSDFIIQPKNQELVKRDLDNCLKQALRAFNENEKKMPQKIVIFRDGVGDGMRQQIETKEVGQFREVLEKLCNKAAIPKLTLVVVNKRINQRMFLQRGGRFDNPEPGTILDHSLVENQDGNKQFDFFLTPQQTTQGCVTPVHYFVSLNESDDLTKEAIENLTYALCFMYSNWAGSIKVPAPCQLAHKIADYHHGFDVSGSIKKTGRIDKLQLAYQPAFCTKLSYL